MPRRVATLLLLLACAAPAGGARAADAADPRMITLVDQSGGIFRLADLRERPTFVTFVASRCTDTCPIANAEFSILARRLANRPDARLVTITLDPAYDTPFVMAAVAARFRADPREWRFASGRPADVRRLMRAFGIVTDLDPRGVPDVHSTFVFFLDPRARLERTLLLSTAFERDAIAMLRDYDRVAPLARRRSR